jgi:hypothetical protein
MAELSSNSPTSSETSTKDHPRVWREAWLARRCSALGLKPELDPGDSLDEESLPPTQWELYNVLGLDCELRPWSDRANSDFNTHVWMKRWYKPLDRVHELSMRASPFMMLLKQKEREFRDIMYSGLFTDIPFGTYEAPIRVPASEVEQPRRLSWRRG